jgi:hypothetical protein
VLDGGFEQHLAIVKIGAYSFGERQPEYVPTKHKAVESG